jgi:SAM-dependent methyltransferase
LDEWDRFHGVTDANVPFVFSRTAQFEFFELLEDFDDDSITIEGRRIEIPPWLPSAGTPGREDFWNTLYKNNDTRWDLDKEAPALAAVLPQLKLARQRILVLGAGVGHDAAYLARQGHSVTAVDFSFEAIERARGAYAGIEGLRFARADAFNLPADFNGRYDIVFEHTLYCAIEPRRRNDLVKAWKRALQPRGHLLGIFYVNDRAGGPPFGGSEWEIRQRLRSTFHSIFWTRWRHSVESRKGRELVVYAQLLA